MSTQRRSPFLQSQARGAASTAVVLWLVLVLARPDPALAEVAAVGFALLVAAILGLAWAVIERAHHPLRAAIHGVALALGAAIVASNWRDPHHLLGGLVALAATTACGLPGRARSAIEQGAWWEPLIGHPERLFVGTFAALCAAGMFTLALPYSASAAAHVSLLDAAFTAVSAVCVTGLIVLDTPVDFTLFGQITILLLIQLGGLGIMTFSTAALRVLGRRMSLRHALADLSVIDRVHNAWFQSVTLRTAGFNSIDLSAIQPATLSLMLLWMFIGGSPGGTAGGIKTTTAGVLLLGVVYAMRGEWDVTVFGRRLAQRTLQKATVVATLGSGAVLLGILSLQLTQDIALRALVFEVFSASATVGLSLGATSELDEVGKLVIIACMFAGRVGPLTLLMFLSQRHAPRSLQHPEEEIDVG